MSKAAHAHAERDSTVIEGTLKILKRGEMSPEVIEVKSCCHENKILVWLMCLNLRCLQLTAAMQQDEDN